MNQHAAHSVRNCRVCAQCRAANSRGKGFFAVDLVPWGKYDARNPYF